MVTLSLEEKSEESTEVSDKSGSFKITKESFTQKLRSGEKKPSVGQFKKTNWKKFSYFHSDEYEGFTGNSEGARAVWDPLTLKTNMPKSPFKTKLYTE